MISLYTNYLSPAIIHTVYWSTYFKMWMGRIYWKNDSKNGCEYARECVGGCVWKNVRVRVRMSMRVCRCVCVGVWVCGCVGVCLMWNMNQSSSDEVGASWLKFTFRTSGKGFILICDELSDRGKKYQFNASIRIDFSAIIHFFQKVLHQKYKNCVSFISSRCFQYPP